MSNQFLKPNEVIQVRDVAHILMKYILAQPDSFGDKNQQSACQPGVVGQRKDPHMVIQVQLTLKSAPSSSLLGKRFRPEDRAQDPSDLT